MTDIVERLQGELKSTIFLVEAMCQVFDVNPNDFVLSLTKNKEGTEPQVVKEITARDVLDQARSALEEKE